MAQAASEPPAREEANPSEQEEEASEASESSRTRRLARFFFCLPEPLPFPSGRPLLYYFPGDDPNVPRADEPWVRLAFHQVDNEVGRMRGQSAAVDSVLSQLPGIPPPEADNHGKDVRTEVAYTVVDAITPQTSPDAVAGSVPVQDLPPRADPFTRCLRAVTDLVRVYRVADEHVTGPVTYERISPLVLWYTATSMLVDQRLPDGRAGVVESIGEWSGPSLMMLDHLNLPDWARPDPVDDVLAAKIDFWLNDLALSTPFFNWREKLADARWYLHAIGDYSNALILTATAAEVLIDAVLALLLWESQTAAIEAARRFDEGKVVRRVRTDLPQLLKGAWKLDDPSHPVGAWLENTVKLRNRVVHGGHRPTLAEVQAAIDSVSGLEGFIFDRVADRRNEFPRATLMTVAQQGLERRGLWGGRIKRFAETVADREPNWKQSFMLWRDDMVAAPRRDGS